MVIAEEHRSRVGADDRVGSELADDLHQLPAERRCRSRVHRRDGRGSGGRCTTENLGGRSASATRAAARASGFVSGSIVPLSPDVQMTTSTSLPAAAHRAMRATTGDVGVVGMGKDRKRLRRDLVEHGLVHGSVRSPGRRVTRDAGLAAPASGPEPRPCSAVRARGRNRRPAQNPCRRLRNRTAATSSSSLRAFQHGEPDLFACHFRTERPRRLLHGGSQRLQLLRLDGSVLARRAGAGDDLLPVEGFPLARPLDNREHCLVDALVRS